MVGELSRTLCLWDAGGGGLADSCRAAAGDGARRRGAGGFIAVALAEAIRRSRTITDGDSLDNGHKLFKTMLRFIESIIIWKKLTSYEQTSITRDTIHSTPVKDMIIFSLWKLRLVFTEIDLKLNILLQTKKQYINNIDTLIL